MTLGELLENLENLDDDLTIYVRADPEWTPNSEAVAVSAAVDGTTQSPPEARGMEYFLEVFIAKQFLEDWIMHSLSGHRPSFQELCDVIIHYARYDA